MANQYEVTTCGMCDVQTPTLYEPGLCRACKLVHDDRQRLNDRLDAQRTDPSIAAESTTAQYEAGFAEAQRDARAVRDEQTLGDYLAEPTMGEPPPVEEGCGCASCVDTRRRRDAETQRIMDTQRFRVEHPYCHTEDCPERAIEGTVHCAEHLPEVITRACRHGVEGAVADYRLCAGCVGNHAYPPLLQPSDLVRACDQCGARVAEDERDGHCPCGREWLWARGFTSEERAARGLAYAQSKAILRSHHFQDVGCLNRYHSMGFALGSADECNGAVQQEEYQQNLPRRGVDLTDRWIRDADNDLGRFTAQQVAHILDKIEERCAADPKFYALLDTIRHREPIPEVDENWEPCERCGVSGDPSTFEMAWGMEMCCVTCVASYDAGRERQENIGP